MEENSSESELLKSQWTMCRLNDLLKQKYAVSYILSQCDFLFEGLSKEMGLNISKYLTSLQK